MNIFDAGGMPPHNSGGLGVACYHMSKALALQGANRFPYCLIPPLTLVLDFMRVFTMLPAFDQKNAYIWAATTALVYLERTYSNLILVILCAPCSATLCRLRREPCFF